jgi:hypothetical protein
MAAAKRKILGHLDERSGEFEELPRSPYAFDGPHINVGIRNGRTLASGASGLTDRQFRVLSWYFYATEEAEGPVMMTGAEVAAELHMSPDALGRTVKALVKTRMLLKAGGIGRTTFYRCHPSLAFIGTGFEHREAVSRWNPPELEVKDKSRQRKKPVVGARPEAGDPKSTPTEKGNAS